MTDENQTERTAPADANGSASPDFSDPKTFALFLELYGSLPRAAPGCDDCTRQALAMLPLDERRTVLDIGCGPGAQTLSLARALPDARVLAFDLLPHMAVEARGRCADSGLLHRVAVTVADMALPPVATASQDLIWCEGAIYNLGVADGLRRWKPLLSERGCVAFTEPVWLQENPHEDIRRWWSAEYPAITDLSGVANAIASAGYELLASFVLPSETWWDDYYGPLEQRIETFLADNQGDGGAIAVAESAHEEISMFRRFGDAYSYAFFIVQPAG
jgi:trans-aconitate methyltransferase